MRGDKKRRWDEKKGDETGKRETRWDKRRQKGDDGRGDELRRWAGRWVKRMKTRRGNDGRSHDVRGLYKTRRGGRWDKERKGAKTHFYGLIPSLFFSLFHFISSLWSRSKCLEAKICLRNLRRLQEKVIETMWDEASSGISFPYEQIPKTVADKKLERMKKSQCPAWA